MRVLALDTSLRACSAAVAEDSVIAAERSVEMARGQAEAVMPLVAEVLREASLTVADLDRIAVTLGPGSFTGVRIGLAAARGLALAARLPVVGITTLEAVFETIAPEWRGEGPVIVVLDGGRPDLFVQMFDGSGKGGPLFSLLPEEAPDRLPPGMLTFAGNGAARLVAALPGRDITDLGCPAPSAGRLALVATTQPAPPHRPEPVYLHPPYAKRPVGGGSLL